MDPQEELAQAERLFSKRQFSQALNIGLFLLRDVTSPQSKIEVKPGTLSFSFTPLSERSHRCGPSCHCSKTAILVVRTLYELRQYKKMNMLVKQLYPALYTCPFSVFIVW